VAGGTSTGSDVVYANPIHWGWRARNINPNRFLWDTAEDTERVWLAAWEKTIQRTLDKVRGA
jgi:hypothetical protein